MSEADQRTEEHDRVRHPDQRDQDIDRPFEFSVFLAGGHTHRQGHGGEHDDELPAPEGEGGECIGEEAYLAGTLDDIVRGAKQRATAEGKNDGIGMQGSQAPVRQPWNIEVEGGPGKLSGDEYADQHAHHTPQHGSDRELLHDLVVVVQ